MLTLPVLMITGMPADVANGTNRLAVLAQSATGAVEFDRAGRLDRGLGLASSVLPSGSRHRCACCRFMPVALLKPVLLSTMIVIAGLMVVNPSFMQPRPRKRRIKVGQDWQRSSQLVCMGDSFRLAWASFCSPRYRCDAIRSRSGQRAENVVHRYL